MWVKMWKVAQNKDFSHMNSVCSLLYFTFCRLGWIELLKKKMYVQQFWSCFFSWTVSWSPHSSLTVNWMSKFSTVWRHDCVTVGFGILWWMFFHILLTFTEQEWTISTCATKPIELSCKKHCVNQVHVKFTSTVWWIYTIFFKNLN